MMSRVNLKYKNVIDPRWPPAISIDPEEKNDENNKE